MSNDGSKKNFAILTAEGIYSIVISGCDDCIFHADRDPYPTHCQIRRDASAHNGNFNDCPLPSLKINMEESTSCR